MNKTTLLITLVLIFAGCSAPAKNDFISRFMSIAKQQALLMAEYVAQHPGPNPEQTTFLF
jgi:hypothetical protein